MGPWTDTLADCSIPDKIQKALEAAPGLITADIDYTGLTRLGNEPVQGNQPRRRAHASKVLAPEFERSKTNRM
jgi:hypothetical protein